MFPLSSPRDFAGRLLPRILSTILLNVKTVSSPTVRILNSTSDLRAVAAQWDELWLRSNVTSPTPRAEFVAFWADHFGYGKNLLAVVVQQAGQFLAALPLIQKRGWPRRAALPANEWGRFGDLLLEPGCPGEDSLYLVLSAIRQLPFSAISCDYIPLNSPAWRSFHNAATRQGWRVSETQNFRSPYVEIGHDWQTYCKSLRRNFRHNRNRNARALEKAGGGQSLFIDHVNTDDLDELLAQGFEVERRSWKGERMTAVAQLPTAYGFYRGAAQLANRYGHLLLGFLYHHGKPIAFHYGWQAKGETFLVKTGYDQEFRKHGPGLLLTMQLVERLHGDSEISRLDFCGESASWTENLSTGSQSIGRLSLTSPTVAGRAAEWGRRSLHAIKNPMTWISKQSDSVPVSTNQ